MGLRAALRAPLRWLRRRADGGGVAASWWAGPRAPRFHVDPGVDQLPDGRTLRVLMTFRQLRGPDLDAALQARWRGAGLDDAFATPLLDVRERTYQMRPIIADPLAASDSEIPEQHLGFELRFHWRGEERHCLWVWPFQQLRDGRWELHTTAGNTDAPARAW